MNKSVRILAGSALVWWQLSAPALAAPAQPGKPALACDASAIKAPPDATITSVRSFTVPVNYCRVDGYVTTNNPGPNTVGFMVSMPEKWNGRYLMVVPGGADGFIADPSPEHLKLGYAAATTDKGTHAANILDFSFRLDKGRNEDFTHRGAHVATVASAAVTRDYYGRAKVYRYLTGCSGGGMTSQKEAEQYPQDVDAIIPGANNPDGYAMSFWGYLAQYVYKDKSRWISAADMKRVGEVIMKEYDGSDGALDGLIWDPTRIKLKRESFPFLSDAQFGTLKVIADGLPPAPGVPQVRSPGYWMSNPAGFATVLLGTMPPPWTTETQPRLFMVTDTGQRAMRGADYNVLTDMDYSDPKKMAEEGRIQAAMGGFDLNAKNLGPIQKTHTKVVMYLGAADSAIPPQDMVSYVDDARRLYGAQHTATFLRFFIAPGMFHCAGGEGAPTDVLDKMIEAAQTWAEEGKAPDYVIASNPQRAEPGPKTAAGSATTQVVGKASRTYLLCSYPRRAKFKGGLQNPSHLDVNDAANWSCQS
jgi:feruloyl esterase